MRAVNGRRTTEMKSMNAQEQLVCPIRTRRDIAKGFCVRAKRLGPLSLAASTAGQVGDAARLQRWSLRPCESTAAHSKRDGPRAGTAPCYGGWRMRCGKPQSSTARGGASGVRLKIQNGECLKWLPISSYGKHTRTHSLRLKALSRPLRMRIES